MNNTIQVTFDQKTRRLVFKSPFHMVDAIRGFPSRRFNPKDKTWRLPLVPGNIRHLNDTSHIYDYDVKDDAIDAIKAFEAAIDAPVKEKFPDYAYDFTKSASKYTPMKHQAMMLDFTWGLKPAAWFAKMGTGKTFAGIHLACARFLAGQIDAVAIIAPSTLRSVWLKEFAKYATVPYDFRIHETKAPWIKEFYATKSETEMPVLAISVEGLGVSESLYDSACGFFVGRRVLCICDESSRIKNPDAKRTNRAIELGAASAYRVILNGTPVAIGIEDLWSQYEFLDPNIIGMGDYWAYKTRYLVMGGYEDRQVVGYKNVDELMKLIGPYTLEVGKEILDLPPKVPMVRPVTITPEQRELIRLVVKGKTNMPNPPKIKVTNSLEKMLRCRQIVGGWLPRAHSKWTEVDGLPFEEVTTVIEPLSKNPKMDSLKELIDDNFRGSKFIIWTSFTHEIESIRGTLAELYGRDSVECYYGGTDMEERPRIEDRYCRDPKMRFFVGNPTAAGLGLTLISGENDIMVYYSGTNAYIDRAQSEDRAHRIGQKNTVTIVDMIAEGTVDQLIVDSIHAKMDIETFLIEKVRAGIKLDDLLLQD